MKRTMTRFHPYQPPSCTSTYRIHKYHDMWRTEMEKRTKLWYDSIRERDPIPHLLDNWVSPVSKRYKQTAQNLHTFHHSLIDQYR